MTRTTPVFDIHTHWRLKATPEELTDIVLDPGQFDRWCSAVFLHGEVVERGRADGLGMTVRYCTKGWLPYSLTFTSEVVDLVPHRYMKSVVHGDFEGVAVLTTEPIDADVSQVDFHWCIDSDHPYVSYLARPLRPVFVWNHKWAMRRAKLLLQDEVYRRRGVSERSVTANRPTFPHNLPLVRREVIDRALRRRSPAG